jgi:SHS2 domain-containing protein
MYEWIEHTAELELHIEARSREALFSEALAAYAELVARDEAGDEVRHAVSAEAADDAALLADWLGELVFLAETDDFVPGRLDRFDLSDARLSAVVSGRRGRPAHLVKAVTYHGLELAQHGDLWRAKVVLDV